eukprot:scaffold2821_cov590-Pavlova_lutheri.AAC.1
MGRSEDAYGFLSEDAYGFLSKPAGEWTVLFRSKDALACSRSANSFMVLPCICSFPFQSLMLITSSMKSHSLKPGTSLWGMYPKSANQEQAARGSPA